MSDQHYLIDSNILIFLCNGRLNESLPHGRFSCSIITQIEVLSYPALSASESNLIQSHLSALTIFPVDNVIGRETIRLRRDSRIKLPDALIAATAIVSQAVLLTNDRHLHGIPGLQCRALAIRE